MVQKYYTTKEAAEYLGVSPADVNSMRERNELRGYRDGMDWKFKAEDIEEMARKRRSGESAPPSFSDDEIVLGIDELSTPVGSSASGTAIGGEIKSEKDAGDEIELGGSDLDLLKSESVSETAPGTGSSVLSAGAGLEDELLPLDEAEAPPPSAPAPAGDSAVNLAGGLDDDEVVISGSGSGSDITLGGDSGISLLDTNDSGISLEEPLELATGDESLELSEDDMLMLDESADADTEAPTQLKTDEDFMLTPFEEVEEGEETESGSQVIALDTEPGTGSSPGMAGLLGEAPLAPSMTPATAIPGGPIPSAGPGIGLGPVTPAPAYAPAAALVGAEAPWGTLWNVLLIVNAVFLMLCGMMTYDLVRNIWSWSGPYTFNSFIMDAILGFLPK